MSESPITQKCLTCGEVKPLDDFLKSKNANGHQSSCKKCKYARSAELYIQKRIAKGLPIRAFTMRQNLELKEQGLKYCPKCKSILELSQFTSNSGENNSAYCAVCCRELSRHNSEKEQTIKKRKEHTKNNGRKRKDIALRCVFGISMDRYDEMLSEQNFQCAICGKSQDEETKSFAVDHDHETGKVRGLLCSNCNSGLGLFRDKSDVLIKASEYLLKYSKNSVD